MGMNNKQNRAKKKAKRDAKNNKKNQPSSFGSNFLGGLPMPEVLDLRKAHESSKAGFSSLITIRKDRNTGKYSCAFMIPEHKYFDVVFNDEHQSNVGMIMQGAEQQGLDDKLMHLMIGSSKENAIPADVLLLQMASKACEMTLHEKKIFLNSLVKMAIYTKSQIDEYEAA